MKAADLQMTIERAQADVERMDEQLAAIEEEIENEPSA
jgi:hypothetical protein